MKNSQIQKALPRGEGEPDLKNLKKPHTELWSHPPPKISALKLNQKVFKNGVN